MNPARGDLVLTYAEKEYTAQPCFAALAMASSLCGTKEYKLIKNFQNDDLSAQEIASVLYACIFYGENCKRISAMPWKFESFVDVVRQEGLMAQRVYALSLLLPMAMPNVKTEQSEEVQETGEIAAKE